MESNYFYRVSFYYDMNDKKPEEKYFSYNSYEKCIKYFHELRDIDKCEIIWIDQVEFGINGNYIRIINYKMGK